MNKPFEVPASVIGRADQLGAMIADLHRIVGAQFAAEEQGAVAESQTIAAALGHCIDQIPERDIRPLIVVLLGMSYIPETHDSSTTQPKESNS